MRGSEVLRSVTLVRRSSTGADREEIDAGSLDDPFLMAFTEVFRVD
jgi:hypothetical protein